MRFNEEAFKERQRNKHFITAYQGRELGAGHYMKVLEVDTSQATYNGTPIKDLGSFHRRKFENLLFLSEHPQSIEVIYR